MINHLVTLISIPYIWLIEQQKDSEFVKTIAAFSWNLEADTLSTELQVKSKFLTLCRIYSLRLLSQGTNCLRTAELIS
jgi:hypothetical protein